jgi:hypothetical protein
MKYVIYHSHIKCWKKLQKTQISPSFVKVWSFLHRNIKYQISDKYKIVSRI